MTTNNQQTVPRNEDPRIAQVIRQRAGVHTATDAATLVGLVEQGKLVRRLVRKTQDGTVGKESGPMPEDEDGTNINVGDTIINYGQQGPEGEPIPEGPPTSGGDNTQAPQTPATPGASLVSKVLPWIIAGTLGASGTGLGVWLTSKPSPKEDPEPPVVQPEDTDTKFDLGFTEPKVPTEWDPKQ